MKEAAAAAAVALVGVLVVVVEGPVLDTLDDLASVCASVGAQDGVEEFLSIFCDAARWQVKGRLWYTFNR